MVYVFIKFTIMIRYLLFSILLTYSVQKDFELNIYKHSLEENTLTLYFCLKNNTDSVRTFVNTGYSTLHYVESFSLLITENDTISLHIQNPFPGFPSSHLSYVTINARDSICNEIDIQLNELYTFDKMPSLINALQHILLLKLFINFYRA